MSKKRVLWLTNTPALLTEELMGRPVVEGSWITSLQEGFIDKEGFDLHIAFMGDRYLPHEVKSGNVTYHIIPRARKIMRWLRRILIIPHTRAELNYLKYLIANVQPSVIHVFGTESFFGLIAKEIDTPVLVQIQGIVASFIPVYFGNIGLKRVACAAGLLDLMSGGVVFRFLLEKKRASREKAILRTAKYVIGRTNFDKDYTYELNPGRVYFHLDDPLRKEFFESGRRVKNGTALQILTVIHAEYYKGLDVLFAAARLLREYGIDFTWGVVGISKDDHLTGVMLRAMKLDQVPCNVELKGKMCGHDLAETMRRSDIYIHTSFIENPSNAICEAMLTGLPVIAANVGGIPSIIEDGVTGLFYEKGDIKGLLEKIKYLKENPDIAGKLGLSAREAALKRHDSHQIVYELIRIYNKVTGDQ